MRYLNMENTEFSYRPFPIGLAAPVMDSGLYQELLGTYPEQARFVDLETIGRKLTLSERYNAKQYADFIRLTPVWRDFHDWAKSRDFIDYTLSCLAKKSIILGKFSTGQGSLGKLAKAINILRGRRYRSSLSTRFEFSMLPADGGYVIPHTDQPSKLVTLVVSMVGEGEWNPAIGGGTEVNLPTDTRLDFNRMNRTAEFDEMETLHTYAFAPNQAVIFVKTFNSWHCVRPMKAKGSDAMRRTLTINIEES